MEIKTKIYKLRVENNLTQAEFAAIAGVTDKAVSTWELGLKSPRLGVVQNICRYFNVDINAFVDTDTDVYNAETSHAYLDRRPITDDELRFALFGDAENITDADLAKVKEFAAFIKSGKGQE